MWTYLVVNKYRIKNEPSEPQHQDLIHKLDFPYQYWLSKHPDDTEATGRGILITAREAMQRLGKPLAGATVAVQGFGNVGSQAARLLHEAGARIVAVSDLKGAIKNDRGLDIHALLKHWTEARTVTGFKGAESMESAALLTHAVDILVPAATENQITEKNAAQVRAKIIVEGANGPTTPEADPILLEHGVLVVPDILANAGGVTVSYFEWVQNRQGFYWREREVNERLVDYMTHAFQATFATTDKVQDQSAHRRLHPRPRPRGSGHEVPRVLRIDGQGIRRSGPPRRACRAAAAGHPEW